MTTRRDFLRQGSLWVAAATGAIACADEITDWLKPRRLYVNGWEPSPEQQALLGAAFHFSPDDYVVVVSGMPKNTTATLKLDGKLRTFKVVRDPYFPSGWTYGLIHKNQFAPMLLIQEHEHRAL